MSSEYLLQDGVEFQMEMEMYDSRIFRFMIPQDISDDAHLMIKAASYGG